MKPCAHQEALERLVLEDESDAWLEAHVAECDACSAEMDRLLEERALFTRRAKVLDVSLDPSGVFVEMDRRREKFRRAGAFASMIAAAAACIAMAFSPATERDHRASIEPARADFSASSAWDEPMSLRVAACMPEGDRSECDGPKNVRFATQRVIASTWDGLAISTTAACIADVTCSVARQ